MVGPWARRRHRTPSVPPFLDSVPLGAAAQRVLWEADKEAEALGYRDVRACHLLLALTGAPGRGMKALDALGVTREAVREQITTLQREMLKIENDSVGVEIGSGELRLSRRANEAVEEAERSAHVYGRAEVTPYDLLLSLTRGRTGSTSDKVLDGLELTVAFVHSQAIRKRTEPRDYEIARRVRHIDEVLTH